MHLFLVAQIVGIVATILSLLIFQVNTRRTMLWLSLTSGLLFCIHFYLLGATTGAVLNFIGIGRSYALMKIRPERKNIWVLAAFIAMAWVATIVLWQGPISVFALVGNTVSGIIFWQKQPKKIRKWALVPPPLWFVYNALSRSYPGMFLEAFSLISVISGIYRFDGNAVAKSSL